jgi:hypothetical protein
MWWHRPFIMLVSKKNRTTVFAFLFKGTCVTHSWRAAVLWWRAGAQAIV